MGRVPVGCDELQSLGYTQVPVPSPASGFIYNGESCWPRDMCGHQPLS